MQSCFASSVSGSRWRSSLCFALSAMKEGNLCSDTSSRTKLLETFMVGSINRVRYESFAGDRKAPGPTYLHRKRVRMLLISTLLILSDLHSDLCSLSHVQ